MYLISFLSSQNNRDADHDADRDADHDANRDADHDTVCAAKNDAHPKKFTSGGPWTFGDYRPLRWTL